MEISNNNEVTVQSPSYVYADDLERGIRELRN